MWDFFAKILPTLFDAATRSKKNSDDIKRINTRLDDLAEALSRLEARQERIEARQPQAEARQEEAERYHAQEMQILVLRLEVILLRHGVTLPSLAPPPLLSPSQDDQPPA